MKRVFILLLLAIPFKLFAQRLAGRVIDSETGLPIVYATVSSANSSSVTSYSGQYVLNRLMHNDTIRVTCVGYRTDKIAYNKVFADTLTIYLHQSSFMLRDVNVKARHNLKQDSLNMRKQFAAVFNYKAPSISDMLTKVDPYVYVPYDYITSPNNATMLVNVDLLSVISLLNKNKAPETKLQRTLFQDEANNYVDEKFSKQKITMVTSLRGDSLADFMSMYRPTIDQTKKMTDYQMILYIKKSYTDFMKIYDPKTSLFNK